MCITDLDNLALNFNQAKTNVIEGVLKSLVLSSLGIFFKIFKSYYMHRKSSPAYRHGKHNFCWCGC